MSDEKKAPTAPTDEADEFAGMPSFDEGIEPDAATAPADAAPAAEPEPKRGRGKRGPKTPKAPKAAKPVLAPREKAVRKMLHRAGKSELPTLASLVAGKVGTPTKVKDIAIFVGKPDEDLLKEVAKECPLQNDVNGSAEVGLDQAMKVGTQVLEKGKMLSPITVARIQETGGLECTSGRHRLTFFALAYGADAEIPVIIEDMTRNEARDAVVVANQSRATKALEQAEHAAMAAVGGNLDAKQDELYEKLVKSKATVGKYCVFSVHNRKHPIKLGFKLAKTQSRADGGMTTLAIVEAFWKASLTWEKGLARKDFDAALKAATEFLNEFVEVIQGVKGFDASQHLASMTMVAVGKYYNNHVTDSNRATAATKIAKQVVAMEDIGRQKSEKTFKALCQAFSK